MLKFEIDREVSFISGVTSDGKVAAESIGTWEYGSNPASYSSKGIISKWGSMSIGTAGGTVRYYFDPSSNWTATEQQCFEAGLALWAAVANISFVLTTDTSQAQLTFQRAKVGASTGMQTMGDGDSGAVGGTKIYSIMNSDIAIATSVAGFGPVSKDFTVYGGYPWQVLLHEEGHALGLGHAGPYSGSADPTTQQYGAYDVRNWTIMSYIDPSMAYAKYYNDYTTPADWGYSPTNPDYKNCATTWMPLDILAVQRLYGAPTTTPLCGGQTFGFNCNITGALKPFFDFTQNTNPIITIWDAGANNTLDLSGFSKSSTVNLAAGSFSSCDGMKNNIAIAFDTAINAVVTGTGSDRVACNDGGDQVFLGAGNDDVFVGAGNDTIDGGPGYDAVWYTGNINGYSVTHNADGSTTVIGADGADTLRNIEEIKFADNSVRVVTASGTTGNETLNGTSRNDIIDLSQGGSDISDAGDGDDTYVLGRMFNAGDQLNGGAGTDTLTLSGNYAAGVIFGSGTLANFEYVALSSGYAYNLTLSAATNAIGNTLVIDGHTLGAGDAMQVDGSRVAGNLAVLSGSSVVTLAGGTGNDSFELGELASGNSVVDGGSGMDRAEFADMVTVYGIYRTPDDTIYVAYNSGATTRLSNIEEIVFKNATVNGVTIRGSSENDTVTGTAMWDYIDVSQGGTDTVDAGVGNDTIAFGGALSSDDRVDGGEGADAISLDGNYSRGLTLTGSMIKNVETIKLELGYSYNVTLSADSVANSRTLSFQAYTVLADCQIRLDSSAVTVGYVNLEGGQGSDVLRGGVNCGSLVGQNGDDLLIRVVMAGVGGVTLLDGGGGVDTADYSNYGGAVTANLATGSLTAPDINIDTLRNLENLITGAGSDAITGNNGTNALTTNAGNDVLNGAGGDDALDGGVGLDRAVYSGVRSAYSISRNVDGTTTVSGPDGTDRLSRIEQLIFSDQALAIGTVAPLDANGDGNSDIFWQNDDGTPAIWTMNGFQQLGGSPVGGNPGTSWHMAGTGDFNGDGKTDILWQNDSGAANIWTMSGVNQLDGGYVGGNPGSSWHIKGTGDFNADGKSDILWQNDNGQAAIWTMDGLSQLGGAQVGINPGTDWHIKGTGDFNGDAKSDILWQNDNGQAAVWLMDGFNVVSGSYVGGNPGTDWRVIGAGDFDGDGKADILWQNDNAQAAIWTMNGLGQTGGSPVGGNPGASWHAKCAGDYNGDGCADILWQNDNGQAAIWTMTGFTQSGGSLVGGNPGTNWHIPAGVG